jgi:hypothetical protein
LDTLHPSSDPSAVPSSACVTSPVPLRTGHCGGVTENESEGPADWPPSLQILTTDDLSDARWLALSAYAVSPGALALVADMTAQVAAHEERATTRGNRRRKSGTARLQQAVGAIIAGLLRCWARPEPRAVFRSRKTDDFTGGPVAARQYLAACDALFALGLVYRSGNIRYGLGMSFGEDDPDVFAGKAPRLWPTQALLAAAAWRGVAPTTLFEDFKDTYPAKPPAVPQPIQLFALKRPRRSEKAAIPIRRGDSDAAKMLEEVNGYNAWIAEHKIGGCLPPRLKRVFTASWDLHGRWYAVGSEGNYQRLSEVQRLDMTINGEPVVEVDVRASHLSIMHGLLGLPLPDTDDLYAFSDVHRSVVKTWITATLGKGSPVRKWAIKATKDNPDLLRHDPRHVGEVVCQRYAFLRSPARAVVGPAGLEKLGHLATPARLLTHRLMAIEAKALTGAMDYVRARGGVLALPMHDGLIVPASGERYAKRALDGAFATLAKVRIRCTVEGPVAAGG